MSYPRIIIVKGNDTNLKQIFRPNRTCGVCQRKGAYEMTSDPKGTALCMKHIKEQYKVFSIVQNAKLSDEENYVYSLMVLHGTTYSAIMRASNKPRSSIRRIMGQLIVKGFVVRGSRPGFFRMVIQEETK